MTGATNQEVDRGRDARSPSEIPATGWKDIGWRVFREIGEDRITLIAAGVTFYLLLALFPALAAFVSLYGLVSDPVTVADHIAYLGGLLPPTAIEIVQQQLQALVSERSQSLGLGFLIGLAIALWSANNGIKALFEAMNVAYDETEKRGFIKLNLLSLSFTLATLVLGIMLIIAVGVVPAVLAILGLSPWAETLIAFARWPTLLLVSMFGILMLYRFGPSRERPKWRWLSWGAVIATLVWLAASVAFSYYLQNFADYDATYGSLGAIIGLMMWTWISVVVLIVGAEIDAEIEHQTARDTTTGPPEPMGRRGAVVADTVGDPVD
ncbi:MULTISPECIES: YihY/virulence factor BrkB family protein [Chelativorans]|jgi:membrane protein|uniref:Putative ribonuclease BN n=1 Tax=Chelativorans sp. (strain BNC1) TaxID=266779 RepID=Q11LK3_CHESB|nr:MULTISPECIES: YihY/virulence factor BrkB family protein [Chelativorans]